MVRCACGCYMCSRCIFSELPQVPISRCPYCSFQIEYDKMTLRESAVFSFNP